MWEIAGFAALAALTILILAYFIKSCKSDSDGKPPCVG